MEILRYTAFSTDPRGGNPAGVVLDATGADYGAMLRVAADVGYSETAFLFPRTDGDADVRYFSPKAEVPFCGHATIASCVALAERNGPGTVMLHTRSGLVAVRSATRQDGSGFEATLTSVPSRVEPADEDDLKALLVTLRWSEGDLDPDYPPAVAFAGAWHPIIAAGTQERLADLDYDFAALAELMDGRGWTTVNLVWRSGERAFEARNPFPPGGVVEDPATGSAAAALGGYLLHLGLVRGPATLTIRQGHHLGRPSQLTVTIPADAAEGIGVSGAAVALDDPPVPPAR